MCNETKDTARKEESHAEASRQSMQTRSSMSRLKSRPLWWTI